jgi:hypothetical protein
MLNDKLDKAQNRMKL